MCREKLRTPLWAMIAMLLFAYAKAQDRVSKPGVYSGYSRMLYREIVHNSQYLTMRDGVKLAATIYRPAVSGKAVETPYPVLWEGTTSRGRRNSDGTVRLLSSAPRATEQARLSLIDIVKFGYVLVQVERRGQGASMGFMRGYHDRTESLDAYDITEWLAQQSWSNGKIGVFGCSNTGEAALHAPTAMPPHLKAVFAGCYSWNKFDGFLRGGKLGNGTADFSAFRRFDRDPREKDRAQLSPPPTISIHRDAVHSSYVALPIIHSADDGSDY